MWNNQVNKTAHLSELLIVAVCGFWWLIAKDLPDFVLPTPIEVLISLITLLTDSDTVGHVFISMSRVLAAAGAYWPTLSGEWMAAWITETMP